MARMTMSQKQQRVLVFLTGALHEEIFDALEPAGFDLVMWKQGWSLLERTVLGRIRPRLEPMNAGLLRLRGLERRWIPIVHASLRAHFPAVHRRIFAGYGHTRGHGLVVLLGLVLDRLAATAASDEPDDRAAMELLARRGVTSDIRAEIAAAMDEAIAPASLDDRSRPRPQPEEPSPEAALWSWYVEWGTIARATVTKPALLRRLGFQPREAIRGARERGDAPG